MHLLNVIRLKKYARTDVFIAIVDKPLISFIDGILFDYIDTSQIRWLAMKWDTLSASTSSFVCTQANSSSVY